MRLKNILQTRIVKVAERLHVEDVMLSSRFDISMCYCDIMLVKSFMITFPPVYVRVCRVYMCGQRATFSVSPIKSQDGWIKSCACDHILPMKLNYSCHFDKAQPSDFK